MRHLGQEQHVPPDTSGLASLQLAYVTGSPPLAQTTSNAKSACWISSYESSSEPVRKLTHGTYNLSLAGPDRDVPAHFPALRLVRSAYNPAVQRACREFRDRL